MQTYIMYCRTASVSGKVYNFHTLVVGDDDDDDGDNVDSANTVIAIVYEISLASLPSETETDDEHQRYDDARGDRQLEATSHEVLISTERQMQGSANGESIIDLLCMYTREALETLCAEMKGKNCNTNYTKYISSMKQKCEMAVDQTVSVARLRLDCCNMIL